jgi:hypothetical protein
MNRGRLGEGREEQSAQTASHSLTRLQGCICGTATRRAAREALLVDGVHIGAACACTAERKVEIGLNGREIWVVARSVMWADVCGTEERIRISMEICIQVEQKRL